MYKEQEQLKFLGFFGIFKESIKIILSCPKIFTKITLAFILPSNIIALANLVISKFISSKIPNNPSTLLINDPKSLFSKWYLLYILFQVTCFIFTFTFSLLSTSSTIYTVACIYTDHHNKVTFKKVANVALKVWKRLAVTMVSHSLIIGGYTFIVTFVILLRSFEIFGYSSKPSNMESYINIITIVVMIVLSLVGLTYMFISWQFANIITVLENYYGFKAMKKSRELIKGNIGTAIAMLLVQSLCSMATFVLIQQLVGSDSDGIVSKIVYGILVYLVLIPLMMLYELVVQTMFYFVCKSYHHEFISTDHLDTLKLNEDYVPLKSEDFETGRFN